MNTKTNKNTSSKVNPYDLGTLKGLSYTATKNKFGSNRSNDVYNAGGKNSGSTNKDFQTKKHR